MHMAGYPLLTENKGQHGRVFFQHDDQRQGPEQAMGL